jgi:hypothetical protein
MKLAFEYGQGLMEAVLPNNTDVFIPGETVPDPPYLKNPEEETRKAIQNPIGMPQFFHYGNGHGTNPILMLQAIAANIIRHKRIMKDNCVVICSSICNGYFHDEEFNGAFRELYELFQKDYHNTLPDLAKYGERFCNNEEYIKNYRFNYAFHPYHPFSMISCGHIAEMTSAAIYIVGAYEPGYARAMGMKTRDTFEEALEDAKRKYVGDWTLMKQNPVKFDQRA